MAASCPISSPGAGHKQEQPPSENVQARDRESTERLKAKGRGFQPWEAFIQPRSKGQRQKDRQHLEHCLAGHSPSSPCPREAFGKAQGKA